MIEWPRAVGNPEQDRRREEILATLNSCRHGAVLCDRCYQAGRADCASACAACREAGAGCAETTAPSCAAVDHTERVKLEGTARCKFCGERGLHWIDNAGRWLLVNRFDVTRWNEGGPVTTTEDVPHRKTCTPGGQIKR